MSHIHTKAGQHDSTASAFIVRTDFPEPKVLLHMHKKLASLLQIGGHVELDETPWQAIVHELLEESGYDIEQLKLLQPKDRLKSVPGVDLHPVAVAHQTHRFNSEHFHSDVAWAFVTDEAPKHKIRAGESADIQLFTAAEIKQLPPDRIFQNTRAMCLFVLENCVPNWERVAI